MNELHEITVELAKHAIEIESLNQTVEVVLPVRTQVVTKVEAVVIENGRSPIYRHEQLLALSNWIINHNFNEKPLAQFFTAGGVEIETEWIHVSNNQIQAFFNPPLAGYALIKN